MEQKTRRCANCYHFKAYYTRGFCCLLKENNGYCHQHEKIMEKDDCCDKWLRRRTSKEKRTRIIVNTIPEIYHKIAVIEQILKEESE